MALREELKEFHKNILKDLNLLYKKIKQYPLISLLFIIAVVLLLALPHWQVSGINNVTEKVAQENQSRATLAQVLGGIAIGIGLYYTWRRVTIAEKELKVSQEGQITERFTRAVDQLGSSNLEIRLGGIYALERIANESEKDYWPIMEILTAYVRMNSNVDEILHKNSQANCCFSMDIQANETMRKVPNGRELSLDIQAILTVLGRRKYLHRNQETKSIVLRKAYLNGAIFGGKETHFEDASFVSAHLENASLSEVHLEGALLNKAHLEGAYLDAAHLEGALLINSHLENAILWGAHLEGAYLTEAHLEGANFWKAHLEGAYLDAAHLEGAHLEGAHLEGVHVSGIHLEGAYLNGAYLEGTYILKADLVKAHHKGAHLKGAIIDGALYNKDDL